MKRKKTFKVKPTGRPKGGGKVTKDMIKKAHELLKEGAPHGVSIRDIAKSLGVTYVALWNHGVRARKYGCKPGRRTVITAEMAAKIIKLKLKMYSTEAIAKYLGVSKSSVYSVCRALR